MAGTRFFFVPVGKDQPFPFDKDSIGLNHLAFAIPTLADLETIHAQLEAASIKNSGIKIDPHGQKDYIWLDDPDGQRIEFYLRPA